MKLPMKCTDCHVAGTRRSVAGDLREELQICHARELEFDVHHDARPGRQTVLPILAIAKTIHESGGCLSRAGRARTSWCRTRRNTCSGASAVIATRAARPDGAQGQGVIGGHAAPRAEFDHRTHRAVACDSCHTAAQASTKTADVLIPKMESCLPCHGDTQARGSTAAGCATSITIGLWRRTSNGSSEGRD